MVDSSDQMQRRHNTLNDMTDTTALVFLGLTMGCARCHDHKFEPLSQRDYYSTAGVFHAGEIRPRTADPERGTTAPLTRQRCASSTRTRRCANSPRLEAPARERILQRKVAKLSPEAQVAHRTPPEKRDAEQANLVLETADQVAVSDKEIAGALNADEKARRETLLEEAKKLPKSEPLPRAMALASSDGAPAQDLHLEPRRVQSAARRGVPRLSDGRRGCAYFCRATNTCGTGGLDRFAGQSAHRAGHGESNLAASFRHAVWFRRRANSARTGRNRLIPSCSTGSPANSSRAAGASSRCTD